MKANLAYVRGQEEKGTASMEEVKGAARAEAKVIGKGEWVEEKVEEKGLLVSEAATTTTRIGIADRLRTQARKCRNQGLNPRIVPTLRARPYAKATMMVGVQLVVSKSALRSNATFVTFAFPVDLRAEATTPGPNIGIEKPQAVMTVITRRGTKGQSTNTSMGNLIRLHRYGIARLLTRWYS